MPISTDSQAELPPEPERCVLRLTPSQWRTVLESRSFLEQPNNRFQRPRRFLGARVEIIPDESFR